MKLLSSATAKNADITSVHLGPFLSWRIHQLCRVPHGVELDGAELFYTHVS